MSKSMRAALAVLSVFLPITLGQFEAAPAASVSLLLAPMVRTLCLGFLFSAATATGVGLYEQLQKMIVLGQQRFEASQVKQIKFAGFVSAGSAYLFALVAIVFVKNMAKVGVFSLYCPESLFYQGVGLILLGGITYHLYHLSMQANHCENRLLEEARQSWQNMA